MAETIGSLVDKLSISELRIWHTLERMDDPTASEETRDECRRRLVVIREQRDDLASELTELWRAIRRGERVPKLYRQYKMYNDPELRGTTAKHKRRRAKAPRRAA